MTVYYVQTSDPNRVVRVPDAGYAEVVTNTLPAGAFSLVNTLKGAAMGEAREATHAAGLKLRQPKIMAVMAR